MIVAHTFPRVLSTNEGLQKHFAKFRQDNATYYDINYKEAEIYSRWAQPTVKYIVVETLQLLVW